MQVPMRTSSNFFNEIQTYILSLCLFAEYNNRGRGSGLNLSHEKRINTAIDTQEYTVT